MSKTQFFISIHRLYVVKKASGIVIKA